MWSDYEHDYAEWGRKLEVSGIVILGGEPLLNPTICDWIRGINRCFGTPVQVLTNGTRLNKTPGLYEAISEWNTNMHWANWIGISVHNQNDLERCFLETTKFLRGTIRTYHGKNTLDENGDPITFGADYTFIDYNGIGVRLWIQDSFFPAAIHRLPPTLVDGEWQPGRFSVHNSDPDLAHAACGFATWKNYHMIRGRLHKCGPSVLMAEFDEQNPLMISDQDRELLRSYQPLSPWDDDKTTHRFFKNLDRAIAQCKFCPTQEHMLPKKITAVLKKKGSTSSFPNA